MVVGLVDVLAAVLHEVLTTFFRDDEASTKVRREPTGHDGLQGRAHAGSGSYVQEQLCTVAIRRIVQGLGLDPVGGDLLHLDQLRKGRPPNRRGLSRILRVSGHHDRQGVEQVAEHGAEKRPLFLWSVFQTLVLLQHFLCNLVQQRCWRHAALCHWRRPQLWLLHLLARSRLRVHGRKRARSHRHQGLARRRQGRLQVEGRRCGQGRANALSYHEGHQAPELVLVGQSQRRLMKPPGDHIIGPFAATSQAFNEDLLHVVESTQELAGDVPRVQREPQGGDHRHQQQRR
mmetsp:Transcript_107429/g.256707  ORF Transcript_107429/g.256707 Transcript_107429/m.256707 type:complete len:288 (-) Transcript_107429:5438-6301(-)